MPSCSHGINCPEGLCEDCKTTTRNPTLTRKSRKCVNCGKEFWPTGNAQKKCSKDCLPPKDAPDPLIDECAICFHRSVADAVCDVVYRAMIARRKGV